ncbi:MAG TPA: hypothetical protein VNH64_08185, partial [Parvularculaceae bacterium]|nr:hypothetical protein [Parvularculaceae bacterium]
ERSGGESRVLGGEFGIVRNAGFGALQCCNRFFDRPNVAQARQGGAFRTAGQAGGSEGAALTRLRHVRAVEKAIAALERAKTRIPGDPELAAEDARLAARALGEITGAVDVEDVLEEIFSSFCIGK